MTLATERTRLAPETLRMLVTTPGPWTSVQVGLSCERAATAFWVPCLEEPDTAAVGPLPPVLPLLGWLQDQSPHVVVVTDRTGAFCRFR